MGKKWEILHKNAGSSKTEIDEIIDILLENRGIKTKKEKDEFFESVNPEKLEIKELQIDAKAVGKAIVRIKKALRDEEKIVIYGDYDADGVTATAILWETLYQITKKVTPFIPNRFSEGYGLNPEGVVNVVKDHPDVKLIITVDNGIVAFDGVKSANDLGVDVIVTDHHAKEEKQPDALAVVHTDKISGSGVAWIFAREIRKSISGKYDLISTGLELCAIGTIADQLPLIGPNRSIARFGLRALNNTKRPGLLTLFENSGIGRGIASEIGTYEVNFVIAPRINAMGRLEHAIDSLRLLCTTNAIKAGELARLLSATNLSRQKIVEEVVLHAREIAVKSQWKGAIVLAHESYHEGVIGLAAGKLVEEFYRPAIVISKGKEVSKASARSIAGFNIIETIREVGNLIIGGGGHPMAAGFSIKTDKIEEFISAFDEVAIKKLTEEVIQRKLKVDTELDLELINDELITKLKNFEPCGIGNPQPAFATKDVEIVDARSIGQAGKHLKLKLSKDSKAFDSIGFGMGGLITKLRIGDKIDIAYSPDENVWNGIKSIQLKLKDIRTL